MLEEAQRLQNAEIDRIRSDSTERDAYVRTLERARAALTQSLEDVRIFSLSPIPPATISDTKLVSNMTASTRERS